MNGVKCHTQKLFLYPDNYLYVSIYRVCQNALAIWCVFVVRNREKTPLPIPEKWIYPYLSKGFRFFFLEKLWFFRFVLITYHIIRHRWTGIDFLFPTMSWLPRSDHISHNSSQKTSYNMNIRRNNPHALWIHNLCSFLAGSIWNMLGVGWPEYRWREEIKTFPTMPDNVTFN